MVVFYLLLFMLSRVSHRLLDIRWSQPPPHHHFRCDDSLHNPMSSEERWALWEQEYDKLCDSVRYREQKRRAQSMNEYRDRTWHKLNNHRHLQIDLFFICGALLCLVLSHCLPSDVNVVVVPDVPAAASVCAKEPALIPEEPVVVAAAVEARNLPALLLGLVMPDCVYFSGENTYCSFTEEWQSPVRDAYRYVMRFLVPRDPLWRGHYVDEAGDRYFTLHTLREPLASGITLVSERRLVETLTSIHRTEATRCLCPLHLGIVDNVSFHLFDSSADNSTRWHIMHDPWLVRNTSGASLVHTTVAHTPGSSLMAFVTTPGATHEHYESFTVEFSESTLRLDDVARATLTGYNNRLHEYYTGKMRQEKEMFILHRVERKFVDRVRLKLSGEAAACFIYCQRLSACPSQ